MGPAPRFVLRGSMAATSGERRCACSARRSDQGPWLPRGPTTVERRPTDCRPRIAGFGSTGERAWAVLFWLAMLKMAVRFARGRAVIYEGLTARSAGFVATAACLQ